jgi:hypothetical protein
MPNGPCPYCGKSPPDWHREWYSLAEQTRLYKGELATDCPNPDCKKKVWLRATPEEIDQDTPVLARSEASADIWVQLQKPQYADVKTYLKSNDPGATVYQNYVFREYRQP